MSKLTEYHIQLDSSLLLKNSLEFDSWVESIQKNIDVIPLKDFSIYENYYLEGLVEILYANYFGKLKVVHSTQTKLANRLFKSKRINRLIQLKELLYKKEIAVDDKLEDYVNQLSLSDTKVIEELDISVNTAIQNPEVYLKFKNVRKKLLENISLLDPLLFIENLFKVIPLVFECEDIDNLLYNYTLNCSDRRFVDAVNCYLKESPNFTHIEFKEKENGLNNEKVSDYRLNLDGKEDTLGEIALLREKLIDGCLTKQEYVNTLFEISKAYKKIGLDERSYFFAVIVNRLVPNYRNVGALLR